MEGLIFIDTSILIDHFRKRSNDQSLFFQLTNDYKAFGASVIVHYEIMIGATAAQEPYWNNLFVDFFIAPHSYNINGTLIALAKALRKKSQNIGFRDMMIASSALFFDCPLATFNEKHFKQIEGLQLITPKDYGL
jgi:predicted nucleic acid-binding protein